MSNNSETGHAVNVANFVDLIFFVQGYGENYNPSNNLIKPIALQTLAAKATEKLEAVNSAAPGYNAAIAAREEIFIPLSKLVTRVMSFLKASGVSKQVYDQVNTVARKVKGTRASAIIKPEPPAEGVEPVTVPKQVSASQMSYDSRAENFHRLIQLLDNIDEYSPNENDLNTEALSILYDGLRAKNNAVIAAEVPISNARIARNEVLYTETTGLCDIALTTKTYVKAVFGATSPQYKQISNLRFTKMK
jgi:hypothetical protein